MYLVCRVIGANPWLNFKPPVTFPKGVNQGQTKVEARCSCERRIKSGASKIMLNVEKP